MVFTCRFVYMDHCRTKNDWLFHQWDGEPWFGNECSWMRVSNTFVQNILFSYYVLVFGIKIEASFLEAIFTSSCWHYFAARDRQFPFLPSFFAFSLDALLLEHLHPLLPTENENENETEKCQIELRMEYLASSMCELHLRIPHRLNTPRRRRFQSICRELVGHECKLGHFLRPMWTSPDHLGIQDSVAPNVSRQLSIRRWVFWLEHAMTLFRPEWSGKWTGWKGIIPLSPRNHREHQNSPQRHCIRLLWQCVQVEFVWYANDRRHSRIHRIWRPRWPMHLSYQVTLLHLRMEMDGIKMKIEIKMN